MSYDADDYPPLPCTATCFACGAGFHGSECPCAGRHAAPPVDGRDPKIIADLLELAALFLTPHENAEFTRDQLVAEMRSIDTAIILRDDDLDAVIAASEYLLREVGEGKYVMA